MSIGERVSAAVGAACPDPLETETPLIPALQDTWHWHQGFLLDDGSKSNMGPHPVLVSAAEGRVSIL